MKLRNIGCKVAMVIRLINKKIFAGEMEKDTWFILYIGTRKHIIITVYYVVKKISLLANIVCFQVNIFSPFSLKKKKKKRRKTSNKNIIILLIHSKVLEKKNKRKKRGRRKYINILSYNRKKNFFIYYFSTFGAIIKISDDIY